MNPLISPYNLLHECGRILESATSQRLLKNSGPELYTCIQVAHWLSMQISSTIFLPGSDVVWWIQLTRCSTVPFWIPFLYCTYLSQPQPLYIPKRHLTQFHVAKYYTWPNSQSLISEDTIHVDSWWINSVPFHLRPELSSLFWQFGRLTWCSYCTF